MRIRAAAQTSVTATGRRLRRCFQLNSFTPQFCEDASSSDVRNYRIISVSQIGAWGFFSTRAFLADLAGWLGVARMEAWAWRRREGKENG